jgi:toxin FitB
VRVLLDTNVVSELRKTNQPHVNSNVVRWSRSYAAIDFCISVMTLMEIEIGVLRLERRDPAQGSSLRGWFESQVLKGFEGRILDIDARSPIGTHSLVRPPVRIPWRLRPETSVTLRPWALI